MLDLLALEQEHLLHSWKETSVADCFCDLAGYRGYVKMKNCFLKSSHFEGIGGHWIVVSYVQFTVVSVSTAPLLLYLMLCCWWCSTQRSAHCCLWHIFGELFTKTCYAFWVRANNFWASDSSGSCLKSWRCLFCVCMAFSLCVCVCVDFCFPFSRGALCCCLSNLKESPVFHKPWNWNMGILWSIFPCSWWYCCGSIKADFLLYFKYLSFMLKRYNTYSYYVT